MNETGTQRWDEERRSFKREVVVGWVGGLLLSFDCGDLNATAAGHRSGVASRTHAATDPQTRKNTEIPRIKMARQKPS